MRDSHADGPALTERPIELIGEHESMRSVHRQIDRIAPSAVRSILIYGETGTGKGMVARLIHQKSVRARKGFVDLNCAAIPGTLLESELFGHERGAFTGATARKRGLIEVANAGTMFLDEIREMDLAMQAKLLGLLDSQRFRPLGSVRPIEVDVRFVAATNKILIGEVKDGRFREDLYYRLLVVAINLPPLRERGDDVFVLAEHYLRRFSQRYGRIIRDIEPAARDVFRNYRWPGNVRELENLIERTFLLEDEDRFLMKHVPPRILRDMNAAKSGDVPSTLGTANLTAAPSRDSMSFPVHFHHEIERVRRQLLLKALAASDGQSSRAAKLLGLSRHAFRYHWNKLRARA